MCLVEDPMVQATRKPKRAKLSLQPLVEPQSDGVHAGNTSFARALGSSDFHTREQGLNALVTWLSARETLLPEDLDKIWKGIFYCFWHSDKAPVQAELAERLAKLLSALGPQVAELYFQAGMRTLHREWFGIDRLRLDKFMLLVRKFVNELWKVLGDAGWDADATGRFAQFLAHDVLLQSDARPSAGLALHLADILLPELVSAAPQPFTPAARHSKQPAKGRPSAEALHALLTPFADAMARTSRPALMTRLREGVFGVLLESPVDTGVFQLMDAASMAAHLQALGGQSDVRARNREALYATGRALERRDRVRAAPATGAAAQANIPKTAPAQAPQSHRVQAASEPTHRTRQDLAAPGRIVPEPRAAAAAGAGNRAAPSNHAIEEHSVHTLPSASKRAKKRKAASTSGLPPATPATPAAPAQAAPRTAPAASTNSAAQPTLPTALPNGGPAVHASPAPPASPQPSKGILKVTGPGHWARRKKQAATAQSRLSRPGVSGEPVTPAASAGAGTPGSGSAKRVQWSLHRNTVRQF